MDLLGGDKIHTSKHTWVISSPMYVFGHYGHGPIVHDLLVHFNEKLTPLYKSDIGFRNQNPSSGEGRIRPFIGD